jgi:hypothetical protein
MKQKTIILYLLVAVLLISCNNEQDKTVQINPIDQLQQIDNLLAEISEKPQILTAPSDNKTTVTGAKGTIIYVDPNRLETIDGSPLGDKIQIELLEMTDNASMVSNNVQTVSNGQILVTGGAYYLNMTSDGKQLKMKKGQGLEVEFPKLTEDEMGLFLGEKDSLGQMNWVQANEKFESFPPEDTLVLENIFTSDSVSFKPKEPVEPTKPLEVNDQDDRILTLTFDDLSMAPELQQYNNVSFRVNDDCSYNPTDADNFWYKVSISKSEVDGEYVIVFEGAQKGGEKIIKKYEVTPVLEGADYNTALRVYEEKFKEYEKRKAEREAEIQKELERMRKEQEEIQVQNETYKAIQLMNFGWINCDRFLNDQTPSTDIEILVNNDSLLGARIYAVFNDINSIATEYYYKDSKESIAFRNIPSDRSLTIIALSAQKGTPYIFESTINTKTERQVQVNFVASTQDEIKDRLKRMN